jgi:MFS family permease
MALLAAQAVLGWASAPAAVLVGAALWGLHLGLTQGLLAVVVSLTAPGSLRGTAFGLFHVVSGIMLLVGSVLAGVLWTEVGPSATFAVGAVFAAVTLAALIALRPLLRLSASP